MDARPLRPRAKESRRIYCGVSSAITVATRKVGGLDPKRRTKLGLSTVRKPLRKHLDINGNAQCTSIERIPGRLTREFSALGAPCRRHLAVATRHPDRVINASRQDLFTELNAFERLMGMPVTDFKALAWVHELQATRVPHSVARDGDAYRTVLTREQAQLGPWPKDLITTEARARLERLYAEDIALYAPPR